MSFLAVNIKATARGISPPIHAMGAARHAPNDREILQTAGAGVAMGNASDEIKALADFVTLDNDNDGVAAAVDKLFN